MAKLKKFIGSKLAQVLLIWIIVYVVFAILTAIKGTNVSFLSGKTFLEIVDLMILSSFLAVGSGFLLVTGNMDLSASAIGAFANVGFAALMAYHGMSTGVAFVVCLVLATLLGIINGVFVNEFKCPTFIVTMSMSYVAKGLMQMMSIDTKSGAAGTVNYHNAITDWVANTKIGGSISIMFAVVIIMFVVYGIILSKTKFGMQMYLVGSNPMASTLCGINAKKVIYILFANSAALAALAGMIYTCRSQQGDINALVNNQFTGMTAAILGGVSFGGGNGNMAGVFVGLLILNTFSKGMAVMGSSSYWTSVLTGVLLIVALIIDAKATAKARMSVK